MVSQVFDILPMNWGREIPCLKTSLSSLTGLNDSNWDSSQQCSSYDNSFQGIMHAEHRLDAWAVQAGP